ncbi:MAG: RNA polymerase subunit sigma-24 [Oceanicaulis sp.]|uniref:RNA polymerase sigma factor n=2 Tax=Oceanicaulis TaxID=153232 RepID=UPI0009FE3446|nr:sigma-70 family RNA polymerase sigma factor [Oceanicaulis sp. HTCC2633]MAB70387.1 RNA polymerase subunit sigma-24 [Oceanicaulis sp.]MBC38103.1 RNA polymerase subunit sigma-24 [Oceanicaulis sp.]MBG34945.1 RNA polymerase subunit sigma-24 [Oceanicaulis sp.]HBU63059.1 sigma-70 family RNA polymerase sigma factor [Oceanicaulis sp.]HCR93895.1 sigma-70 family RNA polymerase sigma factor [Oceanicaulis sp.]|tara:strand:- start:304 stop:906 length:603 start_codon:yes stop_codon:yes gene_type:complete
MTGFEQREGGGMAESTRGGGLSPVPPSDDAEQTSAWETLNHEFQGPLRGFFSKRVSDRDEVSDLIQDVFLRLIRRGDHGEIDHIRGYVFQVARSVLADHLRRHQVRRTDAHEPFDVEQHGGSDFSPERVLLSKEELNRLMQALQELPQRTQDVFVLRAFENYKYADIARLMAISTRSVEKHMAKALAYVGAALDRDETGR